MCATVLTDKPCVTVGDSLEESEDDIITGTAEPYFSGAGIRQSHIHEGSTIVSTWGNAIPIDTARTESENDSVPQNLPYHGTCDIISTSLHIQSRKPATTWEAIITSLTSSSRLCKEVRGSSACWVKGAQAIPETLQNCIISGQTEAGDSWSYSTSTTDYRTSETPTSSLSGSSRYHGSSKRPYGKRDGGEPPDRRRNGRQPTRASALAEKRFACPFFMSSPLQYRQCANFGSSRICDVRQHIFRVHLQRNHCPRCGIVYNNDLDNARLNQHIIGCNESQVQHHPGITMEHYEAMSANSKLGNSFTPEQRWWVIWDSLFPNQDNQQVAAYIPAGYGIEIHTIREYQLSDRYQERINSLIAVAQSGSLEEIRSQINALMDDVTSLFWNHQ